jgi:TetR/AcrR family transcriptional repressor of nem operon
MDAAYELIWEYSYSAVTIDAICERAAVKKGSFYYFFDSKSDLALTAIEAWWVERQLVMEKIFHPTVAPLERIRGYLDYVGERQLASYAKSGQILGCPIYGLGAEICTQDKLILARIRTIIDHLALAFEESIAQAQARGQIEGDSPAPKARLLLGYYAGILFQARIQNNPDILRRLGSDALELIGARPSQAAPAPAFLPA